MRIYLIGFMGSGKSYWGPRLANEAGFDFFDLDREIEKNQGSNIEQLFAQKGEEAFRVIEKDCLHQITEEQPQFVMACGGGTPCFFNNIEYMKRSGLVVWLHPPVEILARRLMSEREQRPLLRSLSDQELLAFIQKKMADRRLYYEQAQVRIEQETIDLPLLLQTLSHA